jgi:CheY-like chemotaxis protein
MEYSSDLQPNNTPAQVLVAEDNKINQKILREIIRKEGFAVSIASNGKEVLTMLDQQHFDLIILDYHMPLMNGLEVLKNIRAHTNEQIKSIQVFLFTADYNEPFLQPLKELGVDFFLSKPVNPQELSQQLKQCGKYSERNNDKEISYSANYLHSISNGNTKLIAELIDIFIQEVPQAIIQLKAYLDRKDWPAIQQLVHKIRPNYKYVGAEGVEPILKILENALNDEQQYLPIYSSGIYQLETITSTVISKLQMEKRKIL